MRAVVIHETGGPDVLRIEEIPKPEPNADVALNIWTLVGKRARIEGIASQQAPPEAVGRMLELLAAGELHPWVEKELPLDQAAEAPRLIESGEVVGRVVLRP